MYFFTAPGYDETQLSPHSSESNGFKAQRKIALQINFSWPIFSYIDNLVANKRSSLLKNAFNCYSLHFTKTHDLSDRSDRLLPEQFVGIRSTSELFTLKNEAAIIFD